MKKLKKYPKFLMIYAAVWLIVTICLSVFVWNRLEDYQGDYDKALANSSPDLFMDSFVDKLSVEDINKYLSEDKRIVLTPYETPAMIIKGVLGITDAGFTYVKAEKHSDMKPLYELKYKNKAFAKVSLVKDIKTDEFGIASWQVKKVMFYDYMPKTKTISIKARDTMDITVNGIAVAKEALVKSDEPAQKMYEKAVAHTKNPFRHVEYAIKGLYLEPEIVVSESGEAIIPEITDESLDYTKGLTKSFEERLGTIGIDGIKAYSNYINLFTKYEDYIKELKEGTALYNLVESTKLSIQWNDEVTKMTFLDEDTKNVVKYGENCFTCDVHIKLKKEYKYTTIEEVVDYTCLYIKEDGKWYLTDILAN